MILLNDSKALFVLAMPTSLHYIFQFIKVPKIHWAENYLANSGKSLLHFPATSDILTKTQFEK
jgi:hypothetical protein